MNFLFKVALISAGLSLKGYNNCMKFEGLMSNITHVTDHKHSLIEGY